MALSQREERNLNPTPEAVLAMAFWGKRYSDQHGGSMEFWDSLSATERALCEDVMARVRAAQLNHRK